jgi:hypothetical protein
MIYTIMMSIQSLQQEALAHAIAIALCQDEQIYVGVSVVYANTERLRQSQR